MAVRRLDGSSSRAMGMYRAGQLLLGGTMVGLAALITVKGSWGYVFLVIPLLVSLVYSRMASSRDLAVTFLELSEPKEQRPSLVKAFDLVIFVLLGFFAVIISQLSYSRPLAWFACAVTLTSAIAGKTIFTYHPRPSWTAATLLEIFWFGLLVRLSSFYQFPSIVGVDPWFHFEFTTQMLSQNQIPNLGLYRDFPLFQLLIATAMRLTSVGFRDAVFIAVGVPTLLVLVGSTYIIASQFVSRRVGAIAALLVSTLQYSVWTGFWLIPSSMALALGTTVLMLVSARSSRISTKSKALVFLFFVSLVLTHILTAFVFWVLFAIITSTKEWSNRVSGGTTASAESGLRFAIGIIVAGQWVFSTIVVTFSLGALLNGFHLDQLAGNLPTTPIAQNQLDLLFDGLSFSMVYSLCLIAGFFVLRKRWFGSPIAFYVATMALLLVTNLAILAQLNALIPDRWFVFLVPGLAVASAIGIVGFAHLVDRSRMKRLLVVLVVALFATTNLSWSRTDAAGASTFNPLEIRYGLFESEMAFSSSLRPNLSQAISDDFFNYYLVYWLAKTNQSPLETPTITNILLGASSPESGEFLILRREYLAEQAIYTYNGILYPSRKSVDGLSSQTYQLVYDSGTVAIYYVP